MPVSFCAARSRALNILLATLIDPWDCGWYALPLTIRVPLASQSSFTAPLNLVLLSQAKSRGKPFLSIQVISNIAASLEPFAFIPLIYTNLEK